jgi:hypothetical protein
MPSLKRIAFGKKDKIKQVGTQTPEQQELMALINEGLTQGTGPFADIFGGFNQGAFQQGIIDPAMKNFQENILPQIQEKFISGNQALGSGMRRGQLKAANDLQSKLAELMYQAQQQQGQNKMQGLQTMLGVKPFENMYKQGSDGLVQGFTKGFANSAGKAVGSNFFGSGSAPSIPMPVAG